LSFSIDDRECLVIVGPSGSGKTTVLRLIAGLEAPASGEILINGKVMNHIPAGQREVAMVFQNPALYPQMSIADNLQFGLRLRGIPSAEAALRIREAAELLGLTEFLQARPNELSGGQRQRVAMGRAIVRRAPVLLLDEPLANLDPPWRAELRQDLANIRSKFGTTMAYVTHDHLEAMLAGDRLAVLRDGRLQQLEPPRIVYQRPANLFVAEFFGFPAINLFRGRLLQSDGKLFFQVAVSSPSSSNEFCLSMDARWAPLAEKLVDRTVILAVRPEQIRPAFSHDPRPAGATLLAGIELVQSAGAELLVRASSDAVAFNARVPASDLLAPGQKCAFTFDTQSAGVFDPVTGKAFESP